MVNYMLADYICRLKSGSQLHLQSIRVNNNKFLRDVSVLLEKEGVIRGFHVNDSYIDILLKYYKNKGVLLNIELISKPSHRIYWSSKKLDLMNGKDCFSGFYVMSTSKGLMSSTDIFFSGMHGGEVLFKVSV